MIRTLLHSPQQGIRKSNWIVAGMALLLLFGGCNSYRLGSPGEPGFSTIHIAAVDNLSFAPQSTAVLTTEMRNRFAADGRVRVVERERAEVVLEVTLMDYRRRPAATRPEDTGLSYSHQIDLTARVSLVEARSGRILIQDRVITADRLAIAANSLQESEYQTLPILARDLARRIVQTVLDPWSE